METDTDELLKSTVKTDRIIAGTFGAVTTERTCFYNRPVENYTSALLVLVQSMRYDIDELPDAIPELPKNAPPITSIAIVRFFQADGQLTFASGNYEATGVIGAIQSGIMENGDLLPGSSIAYPLAPEFNKLQGTYGLPPHVEVSDYLRSNRTGLLHTSAAEDRTLVILVYGFGKFIRQDSLNRDGVVTSSSFFRPLVTEEEKTLAPECDERFRKQQSAGKPTT
jgi:hypothetical protein